ncbi:MAG TPA: PilZ domain-containing protein [Epsilonproteobacteria bacterium]|nr:PilZ domain-containing protein [Campylobacterota bacterium]
MNEDKKKFSKQMVHEAEVTRQYARYKIPAKVEIDGKVYVLDNWSLGGFAVKNAPKEFCKHPNKKARMLFKFDTFETVVDNLDIEFACQSKTPQGDFFPLLGAKFHNLEDNQLSILNQIISSYINGDIVTQEDILYAATRNITYQKKEDKKLDRKKTDKILILIYLAIFFVMLFVGYIAYHRTFVVETTNGYVDANMTVVRAPYLSYVHYTKPYKYDDHIDQNETIAIAQFVDGSMQPVISPVSGTIFKVNALENEFRDTGEQIVTILHQDSEIYINAKVNHLFFKKLQVGYVAEVRTQDNVVFDAKIVKIIPAQDVVQEKVKIIENIYNQARDYDMLILEPLKPLDKKLLNTSVFVTIDTFWQ